MVSYYWTWSLQGFLLLFKQAAHFLECVQDDALPAVLQKKGKTPVLYYKQQKHQTQKYLVLSYNNG